MHILSWEVLSDMFKCYFQLSAIVLDEALSFLTLFFLLDIAFLSGSVCPPHLLESSCLVSSVCAQLFCACLCACAAMEFFSFSSFMEYMPLICMSLDPQWTTVCDHRSHASSTSFLLPLLLMSNFASDSGYVTVKEMMRAL